MDGQMDTKGEIKARNKVYVKKEERAEGKKIEDEEKSRQGICMCVTLTTFLVH